ncbi:hypothetical protein [Leeuwenhoekiella marinoflava]|uniref:hypothetical protein n=1 Tax=Leeuwenhoekiella marinoflava TaxID=988 RepID=UPI0030039D86
MKLINRTLILLVILFLQQLLHAQTLTSTIQQAVVEVGDTFTQISPDRLTYLDQIAFLIIKKLNNQEQVDLLFIDADNLEQSQLAMLWLRTGMIYYGHQNLLNIQSAGMTPGNQPPSPLLSLNSYGFRVKPNSQKIPHSYKVDYGSGFWVVYPKPLDDPGIPTHQTLIISVKKAALDSAESNQIELFFSDSETIAREMLYLSTRLNNLLQTK